MRSFLVFRGLPSVWRVPRSVPGSVPQVFLLCDRLAFSVALLIQIIQKGLALFKCSGGHFSWVFRGFSARFLCQVSLFLGLLTRLVVRLSSRSRGPCLFSSPFFFPVWLLFPLVRLSLAAFCVLISIGLFTHTYWQLALFIQCSSPALHFIFDVVIISHLLALRELSSSNFT